MGAGLALLTDPAHPTQGGPSLDSQPHGSPPSSAEEPVPGKQVGARRGEGLQWLPPPTSVSPADLGSSLSPLRLSLPLYTTGFMNPEREATPVWGQDGCPCLHSHPNELGDPVSALLGPQFPYISNRVDCIRWGDSSSNPSPLI